MSSGLVQSPLFGNGQLLNASFGNPNRRSFHIWAIDQFSHPPKGSPLSGKPNIGRYRNPSACVVADFFP